MKYRIICEALDCLKIKYSIHDERVLSDGYFDEEHDLDLSIGATGFGESRRHIIALSDYLGLRIVNIMWHSKNAASFFLFDNKLGELYHLDIHWGGYYYKHNRLLRASEIFESCRRIDGMMFLGRNEMACLKYAKDVRKGRVTEESRCRFYEQRNGLYKVRLAIIEESSIIRHLFKSVLFMCSDIKRLIYRISHPNSLLVAFLGPDGAGKSTIINGLGNLSLPYRRLKYFHLWPKQSKKVVVNSNPHSNKPRGTIVGILKLCKYAWIYTFGYFRYVWIARRSSSLVVFDRFVHDIVVDPKRFGLNLPEWLLRWFIKLVFSPDLVVVLTARAETIASRKKELPIEEINRQLSVLRGLQNEANVVIVDTEQGLSETVSDVRSIVMNFSHS